MCVLNITAFRTQNTHAGQRTATRNHRLFEMSNIKLPIFDDRIQEKQRVFISLNNMSADISLFVRRVEFLSSIRRVCFTY